MIICTHIDTSLQQSEPSWKARSTASNPVTDTGGMWRNHVSSFPLAGWGQSVVFGGLSHVLQDNPVAFVSALLRAHCCLGGGGVGRAGSTGTAGSHEAKYELCIEYRRSMGFPVRACKEPKSEDAMKQSLRLVSEVSLSMSWKKSVPGRSRED